MQFSYKLRYGQPGQLPSGPAGLPCPGLAPLTARAERWTGGSLSAVACPHAWSPGTPPAGREPAAHSRPPAHPELSAQDALSGPPTAGGDAPELPKGITQDSPPAAAASAEGQEPDPVAAFDALYELTATELVRQTYLLTGRRALAREAVDQAFQHAWRHWPEASADPDPAGWVRAVAHEYALSPWHRLRPGRRRPGTPLPDRRDRELLETLTTLPPPCRRALLLHDGQGLTLSETAAETEASSAATRGRLRNARQRVAERVPELVALERLRGRIAELGAGEEFGLRPPRRLRTLGERRARQWTRATLALTTAVVAATAWTVTTAPRQYEPPVPAGRPVAGVPVSGGQGKAAGPGGEPARDGDSRTTARQDRGEGADTGKAGDRKADKRARDAKRAAEREAKLREQLTQGPRSGPARLFPKAD